MTNHYIQAASQSHEIRVAVSVDENSHQRRTRAMNLIQIALERNGRVALTDMMALLADRYDGQLGRFVAFGPNAIAATDQVVAVIFRPETKELYVSNGWAPPASQGHYVRLSFDDFHDLERLAHKSGNNGAEGRGPADDTRGDLDPLHVIAGTENDLASYPAYDEVVAAQDHLNAHGDFNAQEALSHLNRAAELAPDEPLLYMMRGLLNLHMGNAAKARQLLGATWNMASWASGGIDHHRAMVTRLNLGKALDLLNRREEALSHYRAIVDDQTAHYRVKQAAQYFIQHHANIEDAGRALPDLKYMDTTNYQ